MLNQSTIKGKSRTSSRFGLELIDRALEQPVNHAVLLTA